MTLVNNVNSLTTANPMNIIDVIKVSSQYSNKEIYRTKKNNVFVIVSKCKTMSNILLLLLL